MTDKETKKIKSKDIQLSEQTLNSVKEIVKKNNDKDSEETSEKNNKSISLKKETSNIVLAKDTEKKLEKYQKTTNKAIQRKQNPTYVYALGGLGEVGKNMYVLEEGNEIWIIDSGIKFSSEVFSIEGIIPSFEHLEKNVNKIRGLIITHGHEDHIGAIPHLLNLINIPKIYAGRMALNQIWAKIKEHPTIKRPKLEIISNTSKIKSNNFSFEFFNVNHSIPDSFGVYSKTRNGTIVSTGDFKFDLTSVGSKADFYKMAKIGNDGVDLLLADSTNAQVETWSLSEKVVSKKINHLVTTIKHRIIIATFASNVYRVREIINIAAKNNRKVVIIGWSMEKTIKIARTIKYINASDDLFISAKEMKNYDDDKMIIICTGTQGEQMAALSKMSRKAHPQVKIQQNDTIVFASSAIPGNYLGVDKVINNLIKMKATVITSKTHPGIHASGHAGRLEQLLMLNLIKPKFFFPIHGETMMLKSHIDSAVELGIRRKNCFILKNGDKVQLLNGDVKRAGSVIAKDIFIDGTSLTGQSLKIVMDRKKMSENGFLSITVVIDSKKNILIEKPLISVKGIFEEKSNNKIIQKIEILVKDELEKYWKFTKKISFSGIKETIKITCQNEIYKNFKLEPIIAPVILNVANKFIDPIPSWTKESKEVEDKNKKKSTTTTKDKTKKKISNSGEKKVTKKKAPVKAKT